MSFLNIEIKARCADADQARAVLQQHHAVFHGLDHQTDTYFNTTHGRLKLREGNIENNLIFYDRPDQAGPKSSHFILTPVTDAVALKASLTAAYGVKVVVRKQREIWYIENVKFHIDTVDGLGHFAEIEAGNNLRPAATAGELRTQCDFYLAELGIQPADLLTHSYSDMLLELQYRSF